jgi:hypothetical protein
VRKCSFITGADVSETRGTGNESCCVTKSYALSCNIADIIMGVYHMSDKGFALRFVVYKCKAIPVTGRGGL